MKSETVKVGIYLRLSRDDKDKKFESESIANQREFTKKYIKENDFIFVDEYVDDGYSGTNFDRPSFERLINDALNGRINTIIVKDLSRLGRNSSHTTEYIEEFFPEHNIRFIAILDNVDTAIDSYGNELTGYRNLSNEQFAKDTSRKVKAVINTKKKNGLFLGGVAPYGYKKDSNNKYKLVIDDETSKIVVRIFDMFISGHSIRSIAEALTDDGIPIPSETKNLNRGLKSAAYGIWCTRTIGEILNNPTYIGNLTQCRRRKLSYKVKKIVRNPKERWIIVENTHEPIIDKEKFELAQELLNKNISRNCNDILLKGFVFCKECGHSIGISKNNNGKYYCHCNFYKKHSKRGLCTPHSFPYEPFEKAVLSEIRKMCKKYLNRERFEDIAKNNNKREKKINELQQKIQSVKNNIENLNNKIDIAYNDKLNNFINSEQYTRVSDKLIKEIEKEKSQLQDFENELNSFKQNINIKKDYTNLINDYLALKKPTKQLLASIIDRIEINEDKQITIHCKIKLNNY